MSLPPRLVRFSHMLLLVLLLMHIAYISEPAQRSESAR